LLHPATEFTSEVIGVAGLIVVMEYQSNAELRPGVRPRRSRWGGWSASMNPVSYFVASVPIPPSDVGSNQIDWIALSG